jgi:signal transduction histidine kinase
VFDPALTAQEDRMQVVAGLGAVALERTRTSAELRAMRRRLVEVAEQERQRIERNLHDGAQQRLIGMTIRVAMARETLEAHPELALPVLREFGADVQKALDELRELAHGLYPAVLVDHGLADALRSAARNSPVPVDVAIAPIGRLDPLTEAAVYFCCAEALQNAVKHGGPQPQISMGLWHEEGDGALAFEVTDDGPGFAVGRLRPGTGLMGMTDRVASVGGTLSIDSAPGRGTRVGGRIPVGRLEPGRADV